jgi:hypothetical protein
MLIVWTMDAMVRGGKIASHRLTGITVDRGQSARARRVTDMDDGESLGFIFISDARVAALAGGCTVTRTSAKTGRLYTVNLRGWA